MDTAGDFPAEEARARWLAEYEAVEAEEREARRNLGPMRCPLCGELPALVIGATQVFCGNNDCRLLMWDPSRSAAENLAGAEEFECAVGE